MGTTIVDIVERTMSTMINTQYEIEAPTEEEFDIVTEKIRNLLAPMFPISDIEFSEIKRRLKANIEVRMDIGVLIKGKSLHHPWLSERKKEVDFFFWNRYKRYLEDVKGWNHRSTGNLGRVSDEIVDLLGDPQSAEPFMRRGLVLGDVQSGKTANYTAICNKAADTGYRVIIILAGMLENLRCQTQERLDMEFSGRMSQYLLDPKQEIRDFLVGVGQFGQEKRIETFTSVTKDFDRNILRALNLSLHSVNSTVLFVVKKNKSILNNLIRWLKNSNAQFGETINLPMLLIDDEADNASINTRREEEDPTAINDAIRRLLKLFGQTSYLGITATPFANIFINPDTNEEMENEDLFPRDFIYSLKSPSNYIGAENIFGEIADYNHVLEGINFQEIDFYFPFNHNKYLQVVDLPPSMKEAMAYFLFVNGIRDLRGDNREHRSMMIHVSRFTDVQNQISDLAHSWIDNMRSDLQNYSHLSENDSDKITNIRYLKNIWYKYNLAELASIEDSPIVWHKFLKEYLFEAVAPIVVRAVNQRSSSTGLDYYKHVEKGLRVIAVGGNSLSRGLTLEGLCVSYFHRRSQMYDTLLQMGRWFGYRTGYDDLFKIWISSEAIDWYGYITAAAEELKHEIFLMKEADQTPMDFGLKVRQDPASLIVTARNKMRTATKVTRPITVSGRLLETPRLKADDKSLKDNEEVFKNFVKRLPDIGKRKYIEGTKHLWTGIHKDEVEQLLRDFKTHPWHLNFQGAALAEFIKNSSDITEWDVVIAEGNGPVYEGLTCGDEVLKIRPENRSIKATLEQISISGTKVRVGAGGDARRGLTKNQREEAEAKYKKENSEYLLDRKTSFPDRAYLAIKRSPLLMLHVIYVDKVSKDKQNNLKSQIEKGVNVPSHLFALGIGIPGDIGNERFANYVVNLVEIRNYYGYDDEEEDE